MNFKKLNSIEHGSSYKGSIVLTYKDIVKKLGKPLGPSGDYKVNAEWSIKFSDGTRANLYDYKEYETPVTKITEWHIGGKSDKAVFCVYELFDLSRLAIKKFFDSTLFR
jgi:hypothetical protein